MSARLPRLARCELAIGSSFLVAVALLSTAVARHRAAFAFDNRVLASLPHAYHNRALDAVAELGATPVFLVGVLLATVIAYRRDRRLALVCALAPLLTVAVAEFVMKPLVGRHIAGPLFSYPSGHVTAAIATAGALVLCTVPRWRPLAAIVGAIAVLAVSFAVISLGWHFPTDVLAALGLGLGVILLAHGTAIGLPALADARRDRLGAATSSV